MDIHKYLGLVEQVVCPEICFVFDIGNGSARQTVAIGSGLKVAMPLLDATCDYLITRVFDISIILFSHSAVWLTGL